MIKVQTICDIFTICSTYLIHNDLEGYIVDPGDPDCISEIERKCPENLIIKGIILTHCHIDHMLRARELANMYNVPIMAHKADKILAMAFPLQVKLYFQDRMPENIINRPLHIDQYLSDGDIIKLGESEIKVIHAPGHSPGSIMLYIPEIDSLLSGDVIFRDGVGRTDFPLSNHKQFLNTIENKVITLPDSTNVYSGHVGVSSCVPYFFDLKSWKDRKEIYLYGKPIPKDGPIIDGPEALNF